MLTNNIPKVSIAITSYNHARFIESAIRSVLIQDYPNIEIVICDDVSTDETVSIIKQYETLYPDKIKLFINSDNIGTTKNWFQCVKNCSGDYIIGLAGDDEFFPGIISAQVDIMKNDEDIAMCYADAVVFNVLTQKEIYRLSDKTPTKSGGVEVALKDSLYYSPTIMFCKKFVPKENIFEKWRYGSDLAFYKEIAILAAPKGKILYLPKVFYKYKKHNTNITVTQSEYRRDHIECIKILQKKYPEYKLMLEPAIYDFCCVAFFKNLFNRNIKASLFFLKHGIKASRGNPFKFFRAMIWGLFFFIKKVTK